MDLRCRFILNNSIFAFCLFSWACVSGPKNDGRSFVEKMSGENYESTNVVLGIPILERKPVTRKISGQVFCGEGITQTAANHAIVSLISENKIVTSTSTDIRGNYLISTLLNPEISYQIRVTSSCGESVRPLEKDSNLKLAEENFYITNFRVK